MHLLHHEEQHLLHHEEQQEHEQPAQPRAAGAAPHAPRAGGRPHDFEEHLEDPADGGDLEHDELTLEHDEDRAPRADRDPLGVAPLEARDDFARHA